MPLPELKARAPQEKLARDLARSAGRGFIPGIVVLATFKPSRPSE